MKTAVVIVSGAPEGGNLHEVSIEPGATPRDIKRALGLRDDYLLSIEGSNEYFDDRQDVYPLLLDWAKLRATPPFSGT